MTTNPKTILRFCHACNDDREYVRRADRETHEIHGVPVTADIPKLICPVCGDEQPDMTDGLDDMQNLYDAYFAATGVRIGGKR